MEKLTKGIDWMRYAVVCVQPGEKIDCSDETVRTSCTIVVEAVSIVSRARIRIIKMFCNNLVSKHNEQTELYESHGCKIG